MIVISPADSLEAYKAAVELSKTDSPAYKIDGKFKLSCCA